MQQVDRRATSSRQNTDAGNSRYTRASRYYESQRRSKTCKTGDVNNRHFHVKPVIEVSDAKYIDCTVHPGQNGENSTLVTGLKSDRGWNIYMPFTTS
jgi:hypothetical protein